MANDTFDTLHRMCACDHEEQTHDESGTCKGTIDGESDCKCVSFCFDGRLYDDEIGEIVERTQATFRGDCSYAGVENLVCVERNCRAHNPAGYRRVVAMQEAHAKWAEEREENCNSFREAFNAGFLAGTKYEDLQA